MKKITKRIFTILGITLGTVVAVVVGYVGYENDLYKSVGFIVSNNIKIIEVTNIDNGFEYSDYQPVILKFSLN